MWLDATKTIQVAFGIVDLFCLRFQIIFSLFIKSLYRFLSQLPVNL